MEKNTKRKVGGALLGIGGLGGLSSLACCGAPWVFAGLFASLGLSFLIQDSILILGAIIGIVLAFIGWEMWKK